MVLFWSFILSILVIIVVILFLYIIIANYNDKKQELRFTIFSRDKKCKVDFLSEGDIRWGPRYWGISINGINLKDRLFLFSKDLKNKYWTADSRYFIAEELLDKNSLRTRAVIFDVIEKRYLNIDFENLCINIENFYFLKNKIIFEYVESYRPKIKRKTEIGIDNIKNWENY